MTSTTLKRLAALATGIVASLTSGAMAQTSSADPHHSGATLAQVMDQGQGAQSAQPGMSRPGRMGQGMGCGMMAEMPMAGPRGHMMKVMLAIADTNGDGALSFEEVMAVHKRVFDKVDANKDSKVTLEEIQTFLRE